MEQSEPELKAGLVFLSELLDRPIDDFVVTAERAQKLIAARLKTFGLFAEPANPPDLRKYFKLAAEATRNCHELCKANLVFVDLAQKISSYSGEDLFAIACQGVRSIRGPESFEETTAILKRTEAAILKDLTSPREKLETTTINAVLDEEFEGASKTEILQARMYAMLLVQQQKTLFTFREIFVSSVIIASIYRGLFYVGIVDEKGSELGASARKKLLKEKLDEAPWDIVETMPVLGEYIGHIRKITDVLFLIWDQEAALKRTQESMAEKYQLTANFIENYCLVLGLWAERVNLLNKIMIEFVGSNRRLFGLPTSASSTEDPRS